MAFRVDVVDEFREIIVGAPVGIGGKMVGILLVETAL